MSLCLQVLCRFLSFVAVVVALFAPQAARAKALAKIEGFFSDSNLPAFDAAMVDGRWAVAWAEGSTPERFTAAEGREDILYRAESSSSLQPGTWTAIPDTGGGGGRHEFILPASLERNFVRFVLKRQE